MSCQTNFHVLPIIPKTVIVKEYRAPQGGVQGGLPLELKALLTRSTNILGRLYNRLHERLYELLHNRPYKRPYSQSINQLITPTNAYINVHINAHTIN